VTDPKLLSRPADARWPDDAPSQRAQGARSETPAVARVLSDAPRSFAEPAHETDEQGHARSFDEEISAQRAAERRAEIPIQLDAPELAPGAISFRATGFDPLGRRALTLWRVDEERSARLATTTGDASGEFDFGGVLVPIRGIALVATADGRPPTAEERRDALSIRSDLPIPRVEWLESEGAVISFEVHTAIAEGSVVLADAEENLIARFEISSDSPNTRGSSRLVIDLETDEDAVWIAHELQDGRSSGWRILEFGSRDAIKEVPGDFWP
jgi:hypothetical protein